MPRRREGPVKNKQTGYFFFDEYIGFPPEKKGSGSHSGPRIRLRLNGSGNKNINDSGQNITELNQKSTASLLNSFKPVKNTLIMRKT